MMAAANGAILATGLQWAQPSCMRESGNQDRKVKERRRLSAALRENLRRRKAQARARASGPHPESPSKPHDSAGIGEDE
jgi:hypothetical protein